MRIVVLDDGHVHIDGAERIELHNAINAALRNRPLAQRIASLAIHHSQETCRVAGILDKQEVRLFRMHHCQRTLRILSGDNIFRIHHQRCTKVCQKHFQFLSRFVKTSSLITRETQLARTNQHNLEIHSFHPFCIEHTCRCVLFGRTLSSCYKTLQLRNYIILFVSLGGNQALCMISAQMCTFALSLV